MDENQAKDYRFSLDLQVRWIDLDPLNHVNNSVFIQYFELGRGKYMSEASPSWNWHKNMFLIANITCNYKKELKLTDLQPKIWVKAGKLGTKSFELDYLVTSQENEDRFVHAEGKSTQVMFDLKERRTIELPGWLKAELSNFDKLGS